jgi:hypothetical protein
MDVLASEDREHLGEIRDSQSKNFGLRILAAARLGALSRAACHAAGVGRPSPTAEKIEGEELSDCALYDLVDLALLLRPLRVRRYEPGRLIRWYVRHGRSEEVARTIVHDVYRRAHQERQACLAIDL